MAADEEEITLGDLIALIWQRKLIVAAVTAFSVLVGFFATWLPAPVYEAYSVLLFPGGAPSPIAGLAQSLGISLTGGGNVPLKMYRTVLESDRIRRLLSEQVGLTTRQLQQMTTLEEDPQASSIKIIVRHTDPLVAQKVAKQYIDALATLNRELNLPLARGQVEFLERELALRNKQLREAEDRLLQFQRRAVYVEAPDGVSRDYPAETAERYPVANGTYARQLTDARLRLQQVMQQLEEARSLARRRAQNAENLPADIPSADQWRQKLTELEYELRVAEITYGPDAPSVVRLKRQVELTRQQLRQEIERYLQAVRLNLDPQLASLEMQRVGLEAQINALQRLAEQSPEDTLVLQRLTREVTTLSNIVQQLRVALEQARLEMSRDPNRWEVLEEGTLKERPVNKRWKLNLAIAVSGGVMVGVLASVVVGFSRRERAP